MITKTFTVTENHIKLLKSVYIDWEDCEFGAPCVDCKRPYGNKDAVGDMAEILGIADDNGETTDEQDEYLRMLHLQTQDALQIFLCTGEMRTGKYARRDIYDSRSWYRLGDA